MLNCHFTCRLAVLRALQSRRRPSVLTRLTLTADPWVPRPLVSALASALPALTHLTLYGLYGSVTKLPTTATVFGAVHLLTMLGPRLRSLQLLDLWGWPPVAFYPLRFCTSLTHLEVTAMSSGTDFLQGELGNWYKSSTAPTSPCAPSARTVVVHVCMLVHGCYSAMTPVKRCKIGSVLPLKPFPAVSLNMQHFGRAPPIAVDTEILGAVHGLPNLAALTVKHRYDFHGGSLLRRLETPLLLLQPPVGEPQGHGVWVRELGPLDRPRVALRGMELGEGDLRCLADTLPGMQVGGWWGAIGRCAALGQSLAQACVMTDLRGGQGMDT